MSTTTDHSRAKADGAHAHGPGSTPPNASRAARPTSFDVAAFEIPTGREEQWRFSAFRRLKPLLGDSVASAAHLKFETSLTEGVTAETVGRDDARLGKVGAPGDRLAARAWTDFERALVVTVAKDAAPAEASVVTATGTGGTEFGHARIIAEPGSQATVVLDFRGEGTFVDNVEISVEENAHLTLVSIQDWDKGAVHVSAHRAHVARNGRLKHVVVTLGGDVVRLSPQVEFTGEGGEVDMYGLYFADAGQHQEHQLFVDHAVPRCRSRVTYKGALAGKTARSVWIGDVLIRAAAEGTDTYELNRNLVLTDGARADSVPNLEIETGEIEGAGHASATGRFDDEQMFYLRSRGIDEDTARRLVVRGFFADIIAQVGVPGVEERLMTAIDAELELIDE